MHTWMRELAAYPRGRWGRLYVERYHVDFLLLATFDDYWIGCSLVFRAARAIAGSAHWYALISRKLFLLNPLALLAAVYCRPACLWREAKDRLRFCCRENKLRQLHLNRETSRNSTRRVVRQCQTWNKIAGLA